MREKVGLEERQDTQWHCKEDCEDKKSDQLRESFIDIAAVAEYYSGVFEYGPQTFQSADCDCQIVFFEYSDFVKAAAQDQDCVQHVISRVEPQQLLKR